MAEDEPTRETKNAVDAFIAEGGYELGGPGPHMSAAEIDALVDELDRRLDSALPEGSELERALARADGYEYFMRRLLEARGGPWRSTQK